MANITPYTNQIRTARYGEEVRGSIVSALEAMNSDINDDTASAQAYAGQASVSAQAAANTADGLANILTELSTLETQVSTAEGLRGTAEAGRVSAENARVVAEAARENEETGYVAQCAAYASQAQTYATSDNAMLSKSWAVGDTAGSREGEATNNSKYWAQQSEALADAKGQQWNATLGTTAESYLHGGTGTRTGENTDNAEYYMEQAEAWATGGSSGTPSATNNAAYYAQQASSNADARGEYWEDRLETAAQSWVEGGTGSRSGEDTNNAKYWSEQAYSWYEQAGQVVTEGGVTSFNNRSGVVVATSGDYNADMITRGTGSVESALQSVEAGISDNDDAITALQADKVDKDEALLSLDTTAAASTVDGALKAALDTLEWTSDVVDSSEGILFLKKALTKALDQIHKDKSYHTSDTVAIARNYLSGYVDSGGKLTFTIPLPKPMPSTAAVTSVTVSTLHVYQPSANTVNLQSYVATKAGYMRANGIDIEITLSNPPSSFATAKMCTVYFAGSITI